MSDEDRLPFHELLSDTDKAILREILRKSLCRAAENLIVASIDMAPEARGELLQIRERLREILRPGVIRNYSL